MLFIANTTVQMSTDIDAQKQIFNKSGKIVVVNPIKSMLNWYTWYIENWYEIQFSRRNNIVVS